MQLIALCEAMTCASLGRFENDGSNNKLFFCTERMVKEIGRSGSVVNLLELATRRAREGRLTRDGRWERLQPATSSLTIPTKASRGGSVRRFNLLL